MAFQQNYKKVQNVKNIESSPTSIPTPKEGTSVGFQQEYEVVDEIVNINAGEKDVNVVLLCSLIEKMSESQIKELTGIIDKNASTDNELSESYRSLWKQIKNKGNVKEAVIEYIKSGTAVILLVNSLLSLSNIIIGK